MGTSEIIGFALGTLIPAIGWVLERAKLPANVRKFVGAKGFNGEKLGTVVTNLVAKAAQFSEKSGAERQEQVATALKQWIWRQTQLRPSDSVVNYLVEWGYQTYKRATH